MDAYAAIYESKGAVDSVVGEAKKIAGSDEVLIIVKDDRKAEKRILPAYINARLRNQEKAMHSNSISLETILFIAGEMNISNAIKKAGADGPRFILFSSSRSLAGRLAKKCALKKVKELKLFLDEDIASDVAMTAIKDDK